LGDFPDVEQKDSEWELFDNLSIVKNRPDNYRRFAHRCAYIAVPGGLPGCRQLKIRPPLGKHCGA
jgi:hypothetical protein